MISLSLSLSLSPSCLPVAAGKKWKQPILVHGTSNFISKNGRQSQGVFPCSPRSFLPKSCTSSKLQLAGALRLRRRRILIILGELNLPRDATCSLLAMPNCGWNNALSLSLFYCKLSILLLFFLFFLFFLLSLSPLSLIVAVEQRVVSKRVASLARTPGMSFSRQAESPVPRPARLGLDPGFAEKDRTKRH